MTAVADPRPRHGGPRRRIVVGERRVAARTAPHLRTAPHVRGSTHVRRPASTGRAGAPRRRPIGAFARRPWRWRASVVASLVACFLGVRAVRDLLALDGRPPGPWWEAVASYGTTLWALPVVPAVAAVVGLLWYRGPLAGMPAALDGDGPELDGELAEVAFRIVTRGTNPVALAETVASVRRAMADTAVRGRHLFPHRIEVVTDVEVDVPAGDDLHVLVVPDGYRTPTGARYKARALHWATTTSDLPDDAWVMHLDEESHPTPELVVGIHDFVAAHPEHGRLIGQGMIRYDRKIAEHPILTLADSIRTGDDAGRYHLQHRLGVTLFGLHGSFILVRNDALVDVGFDVGPEGSITEDAFWALEQMARGRRCGWVDGDLVEQSTQSVADFVKQRRRWFAGMTKVVLYTESPSWLRVPLAAFTGLWFLSWLSMAFTVANLFLGLRTPGSTTLLGDVTLSAFLTTYLLGCWLNLRHHPELGRWGHAWRYVVQVVGMPVFGLLEAAGVLAAIVAPERGFHVVDKDPAPTA